MKHLYILSVLFLLVTSCNRDDSTGIFKTVSEITVTDIDTLNINFGFELTRKANVTQTIPDRPLEYEWAAAFYTSETATDTLKVISQEEELRYAFRQSGKFKLRLKVFNGDEAVFKEYTVFVNEPFEEGIMLLAKNENGEGNLSFLKRLTPEDIEAGEKEGIMEHCFSTVNPDIDMKNPTGILHYTNSKRLLIALENKIYFAEPKTLDLIATTPIDGEFANEKAKRIIDPGMNLSPLIYTQNNKCIFVDPQSNFLFKNITYGLYNEESNAMINQAYYMDLSEWGWGINWSTSQYFINYSSSTIKALNPNTGATLSTEKLFQNENILSAIRPDNNSNTFAISTSKSDTKQINIRTLNNYTLEEASKFTYNLEANEKSIPQGTEFACCQLYQMAFWYEGSEIFAWNYNNPNPKLPQKSVINVGANKEITCIKLSNAPTEIDKFLYVGVFDQSTKRGSLYIYDTSKVINDGSKLEPIKKFENQTDRIIDIIYKTR